jgi:peptide chain release factor 2
LNKLSSDENFWSDNEKAQKVLKERARLESTVNGYKKIETALSDIKELLLLAREENDSSVEEDIREQIEELTADIEQLETRRLLNGPRDSANAFVSFSPGAGGVDSADWTEMLMRMIMRYCEKKGFSVQIEHLLNNYEAGIKAATLSVTGDYAYGYLKSERGIHRLVRISPFDSNSRRHTSFAAIDVTPEIDDNIDIEIKEDEIRVDTYRSSGSGGQHVNTTDSAVRITHLPTNIVVQCQSQRSQHSNKSQALKVLKSRLFEREMEIRTRETEQRNAEKKEIAWGSQIRSYVLAPYRLVKDTRTGVETGNVDAVLDGNLDIFVKAYLLSVVKD